MAWRRVRHLSMTRRWLTTALSVMDLCAMDIEQIVYRNQSHANGAEVDIVAELVGLCYRSDLVPMGERIYETYRENFQERLSDVCILASTWTEDELEDAEDAVKDVLWTCYRNGRSETTGLIVYKIYKAQLPAKWYVEEFNNRQDMNGDLMAYYRRLCIRVPE